MLFKIVTGTRVSKLPVTLGMLPLPVITGKLPVITGNYRSFTSRLPPSISAYGVDSGNVQFSVAATDVT